MSALCEGSVSIQSNNIEIINFMEQFCETKNNELQFCFIKLLKHFEPEEPEDISDYMGTNSYPDTSELSFYLDEIEKFMVFNFESDNVPPREILEKLSKVFLEQQFMDFQIEILYNVEEHGVVGVYNITSNKRSVRIIDETDERDD